MQNQVAGRLTCLPTMDTDGALRATHPLATLKVLSERNLKSDTKVYHTFILRGGESRDYFKKVNPYQQMVDIQMWHRNKLWLT